jgi:hypothetical protein
LVVAVMEEGLVGLGEVRIATRLVVGSAAKRKPSRAEERGGAVVMRMLRGEVISRGYRTAWLCAYRAPITAFKAVSRETVFAAE